MNFKKITISAIATGLVLTIGVGAAFATSQSAPANSSPLAVVTQPQYPVTAAPADTTAEILPAVDVTEVVTKDDANSKTADNATVPNVTSGTVYAPEDIEWWTYDSFKAKVDKEKAELTQMEGQTVKVNGVQKVWTKADTDATIAIYEKLLEDIKNGTMVSKKVKGNDDIVITQLPDGTQTTLSEDDMEGDLEFEYEGPDDKNEGAEENEVEDETAEAAAKGATDINV